MKQTFHISIVFLLVQYFTQQNVNAMLTDYTHASFSGQSTVSVIKDCEFYQEGEALNFGKILFSSNTPCTINLGSDSTVSNSCTSEQASIVTPGTPGLIYADCAVGGVNGFTASITSYSGYLINEEAGENPSDTEKIQVNSVGFDFSSQSGTGNSNKTTSFDDLMGGYMAIGGSITLPSGLTAGIYTGTIKVSIIME